MYIVCLSELCYYIFTKFLNKSANCSNTSGPSGKIIQMPEINFVRQLDSLLYLVSCNVHTQAIDFNSTFFAG